MPVSRKLLNITVQELHQTAKAVKYTDGKQEFWVPKSMLGDDGIIQVETNLDGSITLTAPEWWLIDRDLV